MSIATAEDFLSETDRQRVSAAIRAAEMRTSGEIRVHLEDHIEDDVLDHAAFVFEELDMHKTKDRNGVLIYVSVSDRKVAVIGDKGINERVPENFWNDVLAVLRAHFAAGSRADGICEAVAMVGEKLLAFHPHQRDDRDELSNDVSIGTR
ncbi:MAG: TPM domain-containing protein [Flavobacteriales bacterium]|nr:TPM domain-containing protein [Flavobacteriales bacterium]